MNSALGMDPGRTLSVAALRSVPGQSVQVHGERSSRFRRTPHRLRLPRRLRLRSALRNARGPYARALRSTLPETYFVSLTLLPSTPAVSRKRLAGQFVSSNYEHAVRFDVCNVNHAQISSRTRLAQRYPGALPARAVFAGLLQNVNHLVRGDMMIFNVRRSEEHTSELQSPYVI